MEIFVYRKAACKVFFKSFVFIEIVGKEPEKMSENA